MDKRFSVLIAATSSCNLDELCNLQLMSHLHLTGHLSEAICPLWVKTNDRHGSRYDLVGSANFCAVGEERFLITAAHVLRRWGTARRLYVGTRDRFLEIVDTARVTVPVNGPDEVDVGFIGLNQHAAKMVASGYSPMPVRAILTDSATTDQHYLVFGCPWKRVMLNGLTFEPAVYQLRLRSLTAEKHKELGISSERRIVLGFNQKKMLTHDNRRVSAPNPQGMSGGSIWRVIPIAQQQVDFRFAGVLTHHWPIKQALIATHAVAVFEAIRAFYPQLSEHIPRNTEIPTAHRTITTA